MPLFESQDSRNKRLINGVWSAVGSRIGQAYPEDCPDMSDFNNSAIRLGFWVVGWQSHKPSD